MRKATDLRAFPLESNGTATRRELFEMIVELTLKGAVQMTAEGIIIRRVVGGDGKDLLKEIVLLESFFDDLG